RAAAIGAFITDKQAEEEGSKYVEECDDVGGDFRNAPVVFQYQKKIIHDVFGTPSCDRRPITIASDSRQITIAAGIGPAIVHWLCLASIATLALWIFNLWIILQVFLYYE